MVCRLPVGSIVPAEQAGEFYQRRYDVEHDIRDVRVALNTERLRAKSVSMVKDDNAPAGCAGTLTGERRRDRSVRVRVRARVGEEPVFVRLRVVLVHLLVHAAPLRLCRRRNRNGSRLVPPGDSSYDPADGIAAGRRTHGVAQWLGVDGETRRDHRRCRKQISGMLAACPDLTGVGLDYFGYQNYRCCLCPRSRQRLDEYRRQHPDTPREKALEDFSRDTLVQTISFNEFVKHETMRRVMKESLAADK